MLCSMAFVEVIMVVLLCLAVGMAGQLQPRRNIGELHAALNSLTASQFVQAKAAYYKTFALPNTTVQDDLLHQWAQVCHPRL